MFFFDLRWTLICLQVVSDQMKTLIWAKTTHGVPPLLRSQNFKTVFLGSKIVHGNGNLLIFWEVQVINPPQIWKQFFLPACCMACILQPESGLSLKIPSDQCVFISKKWFWDLECWRGLPWKLVVLDQGQILIWAKSFPKVPCCSIFKILRQLSWQKNLAWWFERLRS